MKLLIADDEAIIRRGMEKMIQSFDGNYQISTAADGREAIRLIEEYRPEIILADINMPHINGLDLIQQAQEFVPNTKFIIISGYHEFEYAKRAVQMQVFDYLLKPVKELQLREVLVKAAKAYETRIQELKQLNLLQPSEEMDLISQLISKMKLYYTHDNLNLQSIAKELHASQGYLSRGLKQRLGMGFSDYLTNLRLEKARFLLKHQKELTILEISRQAGFSSQHYFCRVFKQTMGLSPTDYRNGPEHGITEKFFQQDTDCPP